MSTSMIFEHPLNERIRIFLRLEQLNAQLDRYIELNAPDTLRAALRVLIELVTVTARADLRAELHKELGRHQQKLHELSERPGVDPNALAHALDELERASETLYALSGTIAQSAREDEFIKAVGQRTAIEGGACDFDLPQLHLWLNCAPERQQSDFARWRADLKPAIVAVKLVLSLLRTSVAPHRIETRNGCFQHTLNANLSAQLLRIGIDAGGIYPEISGNQNRFSIRFMEPGRRGRPTPYQAPIAFDLTCCIF